ncbi:MAG: hypothetical protein MI717_02940 [Spirochaetales bacterium]|nr:hypothetical protein [Spirochaetales bacterium]
MNHNVSVVATARELYLITLRAGIPEERARVRTIQRLCRLYPRYSPHVLKRIIRQVQV